MQIEFRKLYQKDISVIISAFDELGWNKPESIFYKYIEEQENNTRYIWVAFIKDIFVGYVTLNLLPEYKFFRNQNIPEISDLNVLPKFRKQGIGSKLLDLAESQAQKMGPYVGLGVGLYEDYGNAQRLYIKRGYIPDGNGITYKCKKLEPGKTVILDDDLILWFVKNFSK
ncbi:MAG: GNAT family N-acetyltransferase [Candidatus Babeliales bacterium]